MEMHYIGPLLGRSAHITFHEFVTECSYSINGQLNWRVIDINGNVTEGCEQVSYLQLSDTLHFLNWQEQSGSTVTQLIDIEAGSVKAFCTGPEEDRSNLFSASMFFEGEFEFA